jgi:hypothetical protein
VLKKSLQFQGVQGVDKALGHHASNTSGQKLRDWVQFLRVAVPFEPGCCLLRCLCNEVSDDWSALPVYEPRKLRT